MMGFAGRSAKSKCKSKSKSKPKGEGVVTSGAGPGQKGGLRSINAVVPNGRPSEDWLCQRLQSIHSRRRAGRETMQAMQCNVR